MDVEDSSELTGVVIEDDEEELPVADVSGFSLDNTKQELQDELVRQGVDFKTYENKQSLIDKINA